MSDLNPINPSQDSEETQAFGGIEPDDLKQPDRIGRYRIETLLGQGGFGLVYLALDEQLNRRVAIKVPHARLISKPEDATLYLTEARTVASLDHPHVVPVFDVGGTSEFPCFIVSKYIHGTNLATLMKQRSFDFRQAADLLATVAEALHYAHKQGIVHRDVKPGNILIDEEGKPFVVDFGLALREENVGKGNRYAGTPAYMSPEQARGEGHRVDGRSDIFSLGVLFYEMLTSRKPFRGDSTAELLEQITSYEPRPLRQYNDRIPKELERVCLKAISKRATERYSTAKDLAEDLRVFLQDQTVVQSGITTQAAGSKSSETPVTNEVADKANVTPVAGSDSTETQPIKIVPKGLRSFDAHDSDFFLELLPGARDREGLPDILRFWKNRIEEKDSDKTFSVGLLYGPSGCGKSSLVKAGLLPRLSTNIIPIYVECTGVETETRILNGLRKRFPAVKQGLSLKSTLTDLRHGQGVPDGKKLLIVLDQFEQWLHAKKDDESTELVQALRQCDGGRIQCVLMVRDDFWMAVTRFMRELEIRLAENSNSAAVDLFPVRHAEKVLAAFGRAFGNLPDVASQEQNEFIRQSALGLSEEGKVVCVRLALFAEMMKGKVWSPAVLKEVGGTKGVGVNFLEESFSASTAPPDHRYHQKAARAVLKDLLPDVGSDIRGTMRSYAELLEASGYGNRPSDFDDLIRILDGEIRLITPTDPEGKDVDEDSVKPQTQTGQKYFQLTHDYLVHSLRDWLTRKQKETRKGRAELKLFDASVLWNTHPQNRFLPTLLEWISIRTLTEKSKWTISQRKMMTKAGKYYVFRSALFAIVLYCALSWGFSVAWREYARNQVKIAEKEAERARAALERARAELLSAKRDADIIAQVESLGSIEPFQLPDVKKELMENGRLATQLLRTLLEVKPKDRIQERAKLHAMILMAEQDPTLVNPVVEEFLTGNVEYMRPILKILKPQAANLVEIFGTTFKDDTSSPQRRFRSAIGLVNTLNSAEMAFSKLELEFIAEQLVSANPEFQKRLRELLQPIKEDLLPSLEEIFGDSNLNDVQRLSAANAFADYCSAEHELLTRLLIKATPAQFSALYPYVSGIVSYSTVRQINDSLIRDLENSNNVNFVEFGQQRANAAILTLLLGEREKVFSVFDSATIPDASTQFVFSCKLRGIKVETLLELLDMIAAAPKGKYPKDACYALLLAICEYSPAEIPQTRRKTLLELLADWYANDPSSGVHSAAGLLLRHLGEHDIASRIERIAVPYSPEREWFTLAIEVDRPPSSNQPHDDDDEQAPLSSLSTSTKRTFFYTFVTYPAGEYRIGAIMREADHIGDEEEHIVTLTRPFALLDREVTMEELEAYSPKYAEIIQQYDAKPTDAGFGVDWYDSVAFCRWLGEEMGLAESDQCYADPQSLDKAIYARDPETTWAPQNWPLKLDNRGFRLPTESEWEVAARSGSDTAYGFGSDAKLLDRFGWFEFNSGNRAFPPRQLRPNMRGLFDLHGNLSEWTHDWYGDFQWSNLIDPLGPTNGSYRVCRGGSFGSKASAGRSSRREYTRPSSRLRSLGFRIALTLPSDSSLESNSKR